MDNGLVTSDGTKVLTVAEYDQFINFIPTKFRPIFEVNTITGLRYVELQRLHDHEEWYYIDRNQIILPKEAQRKVKQKLVKRTIDKLPATFPYLFKAFIECKRPPARNTWFENLERWSHKAGIIPKVNPKTPRKTIEGWMLKAGIPEIEICSRQGHDPITSLRACLKIKFDSTIRSDLRIWTEKP